MFEMKDLSIKIDKKHLDKYNMSNRPSWGLIEILILITIIGLVLTVFISFRGKPAISETEVNHIKVQLLFENDGIKMYRFTDGSRTIYYSDARGLTSWEERSGKSTIRRQVETIE